MQHLFLLGLSLRPVKAEPRQRPCRERHASRVRSGVAFAGLSHDPGLPEGGS